MVRRPDDRDGRVSPGFTPRPSLSGVDVPAADVSWAGRVAGVHARPSLSDVGPAEPIPDVGRVSPGFTPRPSLSAAGDRRPAHRAAGVAGVHAPAFVERRSRWPRSRSSPRVSPGFTPRPSLSEGHVRPGPARYQRVSPGFTPRPSLSVDVALHRPRLDRVSPGFTPRPSLSGLDAVQRHRRVDGCRRGSRPGLR